MYFSLFGRKPAAVEERPRRKPDEASQRRLLAVVDDSEPDAPGACGGLRLEIGGSGLDPCVEHAAILFAADHADQARAVLESALAQADAPEASWFMLLELYELCGDHLRGKALALKYAECFKKPIASRKELARGAGAAILTGEIVAAGAQRFESLLATVGAELEIDASGLRRIDFVSAGILLNTMLALQQAGKRVRIRHLSHLVAGLLASVGMSRIAQLETRKY